jgi:hypothetical protein
VKKKIEELPGIPPNLQAILDTGHLVLFIGAGISRLRNYPDWEGWSERALKALADDKDINFSYSDISAIRTLSPRKKLSIACDLWKERNKKTTELLKKSLIPDEDTSSEIYSIITSIPATYITTNYDICLDTAIEQPPIEPQIDQNQQATEAKPQKIKPKHSCTKEDLTIDKLYTHKEVIHFHGCINHESSLVISTADYIDHYRNENVVKFLEHLFSKFHVLFIGYGLEEEEVLEYVIRKKSSDNSPLQHFRLFPVYSSQESLLEHLENYYRNQCQVELIPYLIDRQNHNQIEDVLRSWLPVLKANIKEPTFMDKSRSVLDPILHATRS